MVDRASPEFAAEEIRSLLDGLSVSGHAARVRALQRFELYVTTERPELFDDDVDVLFRGDYARRGLVAACGTPSRKHLGRLKRSAANAIRLVRFLALEHDDGAPAPSRARGPRRHLPRAPARAPLDALRDLRSTHLRPDSIEGASARAGGRADAVARRAPPRAHAPSEARPRRAPLSGSRRRAPILHPRSPRARSRRAVRLSDLVPDASQRPRAGVAGALRRHSTSAGSAAAARRRARRLAAPRGRVPGLLGGRGRRRSRPRATAAAATAAAVAAARRRRAAFMQPPPVSSLGGGGDGSFDDGGFDDNDDDDDDDDDDGGGGDDDDERVARPNAIAAAARRRARPTSSARARQRRRRRHRRPARPARRSDRRPRPSSGRATRPSTRWPSCSRTMPIGAGPSSRGRRRARRHRQPGGRASNSCAITSKRERAAEPRRARASCAAPLLRPLLLLSPPRFSSPPRHPRPRKNSFILAAERVSDFASEFTEGADDAPPTAPASAPPTRRPRATRACSRSRATPKRARATRSRRCSRASGAERASEGARALLRSLGGFLDAPARMRVAARERRGRRRQALPPRARAHSSYAHRAAARPRPRRRPRRARRARRLVGALRLDAPAGRRAAAISCLLELGPPEAGGGSARRRGRRRRRAAARPAADADAEPEDAARGRVGAARAHPAACALGAQLSHLRRHLDEARAATLLPRARQNARPRH